MEALLRKGEAKANEAATRLTCHFLLCSDVFMSNQKNPILISHQTKQKLGEIKASSTIHEFTSIARKVIKDSQHPLFWIQPQCGS